MIGRVATFALSDSMIDAALKTQSKLAEKQIQSASGLVSSDYGGLGGATSQKVLNLEVSITRSKDYEEAATSANDRVQVMYSTTGSIADLLTTFKSTLTSALSVSETDTDALQSNAAAALEDLASLLNVEYGGRYLFGGSATQAEPVDLSAYSASSSTTADTSYYQGNDELATVRVSSSRTITYGVTADNAAFEEAMRAISMIANGSSIDTDTIQSALDLTTEALNAVIGVQTQLSLTSAQLETAVETQTSFQDAASSVASSLTEVDVAAVTVEISTYQSQLEASYSAIGKIQSLNLSDYL